MDDLDDEAEAQLHGVALVEHHRLVDRKVDPLTGGDLGAIQGLAQELSSAEENLKGKHSNY